MASLSSNQLLSLWEQGDRRHPIDRGLLLFALASPETSVAQLADQPLSRRNMALMSLYKAHFGTQLAGWIDCAACGERLEFSTDLVDMLADADPTSAPVWIQVGGLRFRQPTSRDQAQLAGMTDPELAARHLLLACAEFPEELPKEESALAALLEEVEPAIEEAAPWAEITVGMNCPECGHEEATELDIVGLLWEEITCRARRLLDDIHALAQAYGWSETQILALSDTRRAAYLQRVQA